MGALYKNGILYSGGGKEMELTYAEYLALSEAEKSDGTIYYITDINGDGNDFQPIIYSATEKEVGVWIDGKPLYEKTIIKTSNFVSGANEIVHGISNLGKVIHDESTIYYNNGDCVPLPTTHPTSVGWSARTRDFGSTSFYLDIGADMISYVGSASFTIKYTKSTDTPGSGTWTPQGVPSVHYSTGEQVIGTWIDGKTLYEKEVIITGVNITSGGTDYKYVGDLMLKTYITDADRIMPDIQTSYYKNTSNQEFSFVGFRMQQGTGELVAITLFQASNVELHLFCRYTKSS